MEGTVDVQSKLIDSIGSILDSNVRLPFKKMRRHKWLDPLIEIEACALKIIGGIRLHDALQGKKCYRLIIGPR